MSITSSTSSSTSSSLPDSSHTHQPDPPPKSEQSSKKVETNETKLTQNELSSRYNQITYKSSGAYGLVYEVFDTVENKKVAIKKIFNIFNSCSHAKQFLREIKILNMLSPHPNIVRLKRIAPIQDAKPVFNHVNLIFDYYDTDLKNLIQSHQYFTNLHVQSMMYQILCGVQFIHSCHIVHRDLKPANILVNKNCSVAIADFGLARPIDIVDELKDEIDQWLKDTTKQNGKEDRRGQNDVPPLLRSLTTHVCTRCYRAPEIILLSKEYGPAADMWSVGAILSEFLTMIKTSGYTADTRRVLFDSKSCFPLSVTSNDSYKNPRDHLNVIFDLIGTPTKDDLETVDNFPARQYLTNLKSKPPAHFDDKCKGVDPLAVDLLQKLLVFDPRKRMTAFEALCHPYFKDVATDLQNIKWNNRSKLVDFSAPKPATPQTSKESLLELYQFEIQLETQFNEYKIPCKWVEPKDSSASSDRDYRKKKVELDKIKTSVANKDKNDTMIRDFVWREMERSNNQLSLAKEEKKENGYVGVDTK